MSRENILDFKPAKPDDDMIVMIESLLLRARAGLVHGIALIEHQHGDGVAIQISQCGNYHYINSGAARLAHLLAAQQGE
jgi:hypothetical protein